MWSAKINSGSINLEEKLYKTGIVIRIHSNYYYVEFNDTLWECMLRNKLKKEGIEPKVGDKVNIDQLNNENSTAVITAIFPRNNELNKPNIANIDQIIIVTSTYDPNFSPLVLDKFIVLAESYNITPLICVNKSDHLDSELKDFIDELYKSLDYQLIYTSAKTKEGIDKLKHCMLDKISVLTGVSGAGKSSLLNCIDPDLNLETGEVSKNIGTGKHTTRHVSLQRIFYEGKHALIADTPGFSYIEFNNINSLELAWYFKEFTPFIPECSMSGCIHLYEPGCKVKENIDLEGSRYNNYINILLNIIEIEKIQRARSSKKETQVKISRRADGKHIRIVKLGSQSKESNRRTIKQELDEIGKINSVEDLEDDI